jgi:hypothetical protein
MKKAVAGVVAGLLMGAFSTVSAIDMSWGLGAHYANDFGGIYDVSYRMTVLSTSYDVKESASWTGFGVGGFFDATYAQIGLGVTLGSMKQSVETNAPVSVGGGTGSTMSLDISLMGKYPIEVTGLTLFPLAGIEYFSNFAGGIEGGDLGPGDVSALWIKFGAGLDLSLGEKMFLRPTLLYGIRMANNVEKTFFENVPSSLVTLSNKESKEGGNGLTIKVSLGFRL